MALVVLVFLKLKTTILPQRDSGLLIMQNAVLRLVEVAIPISIGLY